jgi:hypothetical protein
MMLTIPLPRGRFMAPSVDALRPYLKHVWHLEEAGTANRNDSIGSQHLAHAGTPGNAAGKYGKALDCNGSSQRVGVDASPLTDPDSPWLVSLWYKADARGGCVFGSDKSGGYPMLLVIAASGYTGFNVWWTGPGGGDYSDTNTQATGTWYHVAAAHDPGNADVRCYTQGTHRGNIAIGSSINVADYFRVGCRAYGTGDNNYFDGLVDECCIWEGMAWENTAHIDKVVRELYRAGEGSYYR